MKCSIFSILVIVLLARLAVLQAAEPPLTFPDPMPQCYHLTARASQIDPRARSHPEINFVFEKGGKAADTENASVDTRVKPQGKLVIWLMGYSAPLFERVNSYGLHAIGVHYANGWFGKFGNATPPDDDKFLGKIRLEAATGEQATVETTSSESTAADDGAGAVAAAVADGRMRRQIAVIRGRQEMVDD